jgi:ParB family transcriptional regulator, chromosome partitioning protein
MAIGTRGRAGDEGPLKPSDAKYASLSPQKIRANPENPRLFFTDESIEQLAESIQLEGILVPITVYEDKRGDSTHVLLDGERRWRAAKLINMPAVPAWVIPKPGGIENTIRMFNIHMLREEWAEMPVAQALDKLMKQLKIDSPEELHRITGLSTDRIRNIKIVLGFPKEHQELVLEDKLSFNYLVELQKNVLRKLKADREQKGETPLRKNEKDVRQAFIKKYLDSVDTDPIALRQVGKLIDTAKLSGSVGARARTALNKLVSDPQMKVEEAYELGAAASVELRRVLRDVEELPGRLSVVLKGKVDASEAKALRAEMRKLQKALADLLASHSD